MPDPEKKSLAAALADVTEEDVASATEADEAAEAGEEAAAPEKKGEAEPEKADDAEAPEVEGEEDEDDEEEGEEEDASAAEADDATPFDDLTPEQLRAIKANPDTHALFKSVMRAYTKGTQDASEALRLVRAFQTNPDAVMAQIAAARGGEYKPPKGAAAKADEPVVDADAALSAAVKELEGLFGDKLGPRVRGVFERWFEARIAPIVSPLKSSLGKVISLGEQQRMLGEEQAFKVRHEAVLTPEIEDEIVKLGESGTILPGNETSPAEYLDLLTEIVLSRHGKKAARSAKREATEALARKIARNAGDREPSGQSGRAPVRKVSGVKPTMSLSEAFDAADAELTEEGM